MRPRLKLRYAVALAATIGWASVSHADLNGFALPPTQEVIDGNHVDLTTGTVVLMSPAISVGPSGEGLTFQRRNATNGGWPTEGGGIYAVGGKYRVVLGGSSQDFNTDYSSVEPSGARLTYNSVNGFFTYTLADGTSVTFDTSLGTPLTTVGEPTPLARLRSIKYPSGRFVNYRYEDATFNSGPQIVHHYRLMEITSSNGYYLEFHYQADQYVDTYIGPWHWLTSVTSGNQAGGSGPYPSLTLGAMNSPPTYTDAAGGVTRFSQASGKLTVQYPGTTGTTYDFTAYVDSSGRATQVINRGVTTSYSFSDAGTTRTVKVTYLNDAGNKVTQRTLTVDIPSLHVLTDKDALGHQTTYAYWGLGGNANAGLLKSVTRPEGGTNPADHKDTTVYTYDSRGNRTATQIYSKDGASSFTSQASYPATCSDVDSDQTNNSVQCNQPTSTTDIRGKVTNYTYDATHGGVVKVTRPAVGGIRPETRYTYGAKPAYSGDPIWKLVSTSACQALAACTGGADEVVTTYSYSSGNLLPTKAVVTKGDGSAIEGIEPSVTKTQTTLTYDDVGNVRSLDHYYDQSWYRYDALRRRTGAISVDPDGSGPLKPRATWTKYNADGTINQIITGTDTTPSALSFDNFSGKVTRNYSYDNGRPNAAEIFTVENGNGLPETRQGVTQWEYDTRGRLKCTAVRMTKTGWDTDAEYRALPGACTQAAGSVDRITVTGYDLADRPTNVTINGANTGKTDYTANGRTSWVADGNGNKTSYIYDGFDRLSETHFPDSSKPAGSSSSTDVESITYTVNGSTDLTEVTGRDRVLANAVRYYRDDLGRLGLRTRRAAGESNLTYTYDNFGRLLKVGDGTEANDESFTYNAVGNQITASGRFGTSKSFYDPMGRRTKLQWPDTNFAVRYTFLTTGEIKAIAEGNPSVDRITFTYDDLGRRTKLLRDNGTYTDYDYNGVSQLTSLAHSFPAVTTANQTIGLQYNAAGQISQKTSSNDAFSWNDQGNVTRQYTPNGLNQYTSIGKTPYAYTYDSRGDLATEKAGSTVLGSFTYSSEGLMKTGRVVPDPAAPGTVLTTGLSYDNLDRLTQTVENTETGGQAGAATTTRYAYDGGHIIAEYDAAGTTVLNRYVFGPGDDEPLVWYKYAGGSDRRYFHADERGSIIAVTNQSGQTTEIDAYDEYGIPAWDNGPSRFGYTGQAYLPNLGMWNFKARIYSPTLGRFMQTDPIGYGDGPNWYNYAHGDPINGADPSGTQDTSCVSMGTGAGSNPNCSDATGADIVVNGIKSSLSHCGLGCMFHRVVSAISSIFSDRNRILDAGFAKDTVKDLAFSSAVLVTAAAGPVAAEGIATPYGIAAQEFSTDALAARDAVEGGATLYRGGTLGVSAGPEGQFWSLENPLNPGYAERYGIPAGNMNFNFVESGTLNSGGSFITRAAPGIGNNTGGAIEVVTPSGGVTLNGFTMP